MPALPARYLSTKPMPIPRFLLGLVTLLAFLFSWKGLCTSFTVGTASGLIYAGRMFDNFFVLILGVVYMLCAVVLLFLDAAKKPLVG